MSIDRYCPLCGCGYTARHDSETTRAYICGDGCGAWEFIIKGRVSWWYHGAKPESDWPAD